MPMTSRIGGGDLGDEAILIRGKRRLHKTRVTIATTNKDTMTDEQSAPFEGALPTLLPTIRGQRLLRTVNHIIGLTAMHMAGANFIMG
jgi:hypothetical protein